jgi:hypothetical protein
MRTSPAASLELLAGLYYSAAQKHKLVRLWWNKNFDARQF